MAFRRTVAPTTRGGKTGARPSRAPLFRGAPHLKFGREITRSVDTQPAHARGRRRSGGIGWTRSSAGGREAAHVRSSRRRFLETAIAAGAAAPWTKVLGAANGLDGVAAEPARRRAGPLVIDASAVPLPVRQGHLRMGAGRSPAGR